MQLTIGMPTYDDPRDVWFTVQALRLYHDLADVEVLVVDNYGCDHTRRFVEDWAGPGVRYVRDVALQGTAAAKNAVFAHAAGAWVLCMDSHVLLHPGVVARLRGWTAARPACDDLHHGPLVYDDLTSQSTRMDPVWRGEMWGIWAGEAVAPEAEPFDIPMMGTGLMVCRREAWLGFPATFRGFGAEEGIIHETFRQAGRRVLCLPWLTWTHRFHVQPPSYPLRLEDKVRNYLLGFWALGLDDAPIAEHFGAAVVARVKRGLA